MSSFVKALSLLEAYEERQQEAQALWKKSQWNITKTKQSKGSADSLMASNVREDLRSRCVLIEDTPELVDEDSDRKEYPRMPRFKLVDPVEQKLTDKENTVQTNSTESKESGLRNRKAKNTNDTESKEWTVTEDSEIVDEETKLQLVDPIELFGLPTRELRQARTQAHDAVQVYVEAANILVQLQQEMKK